MRSEKQIKEKIKEMLARPSDYYSPPREFDSKYGQFEDVSTKYIICEFEVPLLEWVLGGKPRYSEEDLLKIVNPPNGKSALDLSTEEYQGIACLLRFLRNTKKVEEILK